MTTRELTKREREKKKYLTTSQLRERWGDCSHMTIERKLRDDPRFPKAYRFTRFRLFDLDEIEEYERIKAAES